MFNRLLFRSYIYSNTFKYITIFYYFLMLFIVLVSFISSFIIFSIGIYFLFLENDKSNYPLIKYLKSLILSFLFSSLLDICIIHFYYNRKNGFRKTLTGSLLLPIKLSSITRPNSPFRQNTTQNSPT